MLLSMHTGLLKNTHETQTWVFSSKGVFTTGFLMDSVVVRLDNFLTQSVLLELDMVLSEQCCSVNPSPWALLLPAGLAGLWRNRLHLLPVLSPPPELTAKFFLNFGSHCSLMASEGEMCSWADNQWLASCTTHYCVKDLACPWRGNHVRCVDTELNSYPTGGNAKPLSHRSSCQSACLHARSLSE